jgi:preprotein translocase subunit YajC
MTVCSLLAPALILAQTSRPAPQGEISSTYIWGGMLLFMGVFYFMLFRSRSKQQQEVQKRLNNLKRNDRVLTIGGIYGTIVDVRENDVVLKIDETSNVKVRFLKSAIQSVITDTPETK